MRTRTNIYIGDGEEGFAKILKNFYKAGCVDLVFDDGEDVERMLKALEKAGYTVLLSQADEYEGREYFAVALGKEAFESVKFCKGKFACFVTFFTADMFVGDRYPEFLYFDGNEYSSLSEDRVYECYSALLAAECEGLSVYYRGKGAPFVDKGLKRSLERGRSVLLGEADKDNFVSDAVALSKEIAEKLPSENCGFTACRMAENLGGSVGDYIESACFLHRALILFTKWEFSDMLITVESPIEGVAAGYPRHTEADLIIDDADMKKIFSFVDGCRARNGTVRLIKAYKQSASAEDIGFAEIYNRGIYEGILGYD